METDEENGWIDIKVNHYEILTNDILEQTSDDDLDLTIVTHVDDLIGDDRSKAYEIVKSLSSGIQMVYATWELEGEVFNGGFLQFFWNSSGQFAMEALEGYKLIGAAKHAELVKKAINVFMKRIPRLAPLRWIGTIEAFFRASKREEALDKLSEQFWPIQDEAAPLRHKYIREHLDQFVGY